MASKRLNVLVYNVNDQITPADLDHPGAGATHNALRHALFTLRRILTPNYAVLPLSTQALLTEPWQATCALLVMPGGADLQYCNALNGAGNKRIRAFVERGGAYLGLCAGGYYGSAKCEFEVGQRGMEVIGDRELKFFPGICRGCAFPGFKYETEAGTRAAEIKVERQWFEGRVPESFKVYYNGGGVFVDANKYKDKGVEVLATYTETDSISVDGGDAAGGPAAVVYCKVGSGGALLMSPHPEFSAPNLEVLHYRANPDQWPKTLEKIKRDEQLRSDFMRGCLTKLGLKVSDETNVTPSLSKLYLSSQTPEGIEKLMNALGEIITSENGQEYIRDESDSFILERPSTFSVASLQKALSSEADGTDSSEARPDGTTSSVAIGKVGDTANLTTRDQITDFAAIVKPISVHATSPPSSKETPYFDHSAYFTNLAHYYASARESNTDIGKNLMYGEVVTSTQSILEKNTKLLRTLPHGFTLAATTQVAGRGRGSNVWVSPAGALIFSTILHHPAALQPRAPVVFIQYLAAMAVVDAVRTYDAGFASLDVRLKWPNDIYARDPNAAPGASGPARYTKIGGVLVNSHYSATTYHSVLGVGLNVSNAGPTTSLNSLLARWHPRLQPFTAERLLARVLAAFSALYTRFRRTGWDEYLEEKYYAMWLHSGQIVNLEMEAGKRARIVGITADWGLLVAEECDEEGRGYGRKIELQSDSNSFDFFKGLVKRKI